MENVEIMKRKEKGPMQKVGNFITKKDYFMLKETLLKKKDIKLMQKVGNFKRENGSFVQKI